MTSTADLVIIGAGAAGLMAGIWAGRAAQIQHRHSTTLILDGARKPGAKILVSGGGRCNITHDFVDETAYAGSSRHAIKKVLRRFDVSATIQFFRELGVELKHESTGKLFPVTNDAHTVLDALLSGVQQAGVSICHPQRVEAIRRVNQDKYAFAISGAWGEILSRRVILATGGKSLPKSGSDGHGYVLAQALGHSLTSRILPALVPLLLPAGHFLRDLSGLTVNATLDLFSGTGKRLITFTDSTLCTHFGLSGPSVLDFSRYYLDARHNDPGVMAAINWLPGCTTEQADIALQGLGKTSVLRWLDGKLPDRLLRAICAHVGIEPTTSGDQIPRERRKALAKALTQLPLPFTGDRGYNYAEVTAGGVPLSEIRLETMESRVCPGLYLCGEMCDVDGRVGGYNFQWAWSSGYVAGTAAGTN